jgi:hypothetical protein
VVVPCAELDLELDAEEERRARMEDEAVRAFLEVRGKLCDPPVVVRGPLGDEVVRDGHLALASEEDIAKEHRRQARRFAP